MSKDYRPWKIDEAQLLPPSVQDYVPKDHLARLIVALVREELDLSAISGSYRSALGQPPFAPRMMTAVLLHGYASGIYSSRRIARAAVERADFMMIVAGDPPDFRTISEFRRRHLKARAGVEAGRESRFGETRARCAGRHQDQGECVETQSDELRADEEAGSGASSRSRALAKSRRGRRCGGRQALRRQAWRRDARLGGRQREAACEDPRRQGGAGGGSQSRRRRRDATPRRGGRATQERRPQEDRQD